VTTSQDIRDYATVGAHTYGEAKMRWYPAGMARCTIGRYCSIGENVIIAIGGEHPTDYVSTFPLRIKYELPGAYADGLPTTKGDVIVGNDVWTGNDALILSGVRIGDGAVIGTRAVVAKDVLPYAVAVGNPARMVKRRFTEEQIDRLLVVRWWDWPDADVIDAAPLLNSPDIEGFLQYAEGRRA